MHPSYAQNKVIFEDTFSSPSLDQSNWNPWMGDDRYGRWRNRGKLPAPYSAMNEDDYQVSYYDPYSYGHDFGAVGDKYIHLLQTDAGLQFTATLSTRFSPYTWASACISTYGGYYLPKEGFYLETKARLADGRYGGWSSLWLLPRNHLKGAEFDIVEHGYGAQGSPEANSTIASNWHGASGIQQFNNTGIDLSKDFHLYGCEYIPGKAWRVYFDDELIAEWTRGVSSETDYQLIIDLEMAGPDAKEWHTYVERGFPGPFTMTVEYVRAYSLTEKRPVEQPVLRAGQRVETIAFVDGAYADGPTRGTLRQLPSGLWIVQMDTAIAPYDQTKFTNVYE